MASALAVVAPGLPRFSMEFSIAVTQEAWPPLPLPDIEILAHPMYQVLLRGMSSSCLSLFGLSPRHCPLCCLNQAPLILTPLKLVLLVFVHALSLLLSFSRFCLHTLQSIPLNLALLQPFEQPFQVLDISRFALQVSPLAQIIVPWCRDVTKPNNGSNNSCLDSN